MGTHTEKRIKRILENTEEEIDAIIIDRSIQPGSVMLLRFISKDMGTAVGLENNLIPKKIELYQNIPNPFNPETKIRFYLPQSVHIKLTIFDSRGRTQKLLNGKYPAGEHRIKFNADGLSSGIYFYSLECGSFRQCRKMLLIQ